MYPIPANATRIRYVESTGTQYVDTGIVPTQTTKIGFAYLLTQTPTDGYASAFGCIGATGGATNSENLYSGFALFNNPSVPVQARIGRNTAANIVSGVSVAANVRYEGEVQFGLMRLNGTEYTQSGSGSWITMVRTICTHTANDRTNTVSRRFVCARFYSFSIYDGSTLVRDFIPVRVGQVGYLYDRVSGQLFGNSGAGDFVLGPDVRQGVVPTRMMPMGVHDALPYTREVEYLQSTGTQYIDSGVLIGATTRIESGFSCVNASRVKSKAFYGVVDPTLGENAHRTTSSGYAISIIKGDGLQNNYDPVSPREVNSTIDFGTGYVFVQIKNTASYIKNATANKTPLTDSCSLPFYIFARNNNQTVDMYHSVRFRKMRVYESGTLVRDFIPVRVGTVGYLYDKVSKQLFGNAGTGSFTLGPDK